MLSGDFSHGPQHVFWTCLDQIVKSNDISFQKNIGFGQVKMKMDGLTKTKIKSKNEITNKIMFFKEICHILDVYV